MIRGGFNISSTILIAPPLAPGIFLGKGSRTVLTADTTLSNLCVVGAVGETQIKQPSLVANGSELELNVD